MADKTSERASHKGILVPDPRYVRANIWDSASTLARTNEGPAPSTPAPQADQDLAIEISGDIAAETTYEITARKAGFPGADRAGFTWKTSTDTDERGWHPPNLPMGLEAVVTLGSGPTALDATATPHAVTLSDGTVVLAYQATQTVLSTQKDSVRVKTFDPDTSSWSSSGTVFTHSSTYSTGRAAHPCLAVLDDDRVLLAHWRELDAGDVQVSTWLSSDKGSSWSLVSRFALDQRVTYAASSTGASDEDFSQIGRLRMAYKDGQLLLMAHVRIAKENTGSVSAYESRETFIQWASSDLGSSFSLLENSNATYKWTVDPSDVDQLHAAGGYHDIIVADGYFQIFFISMYLSDGSGAKGTTLTGPHVRVQRLANAYQHFTDGESEYVTLDSGDRIQAAETSTTSSYSYIFSDGDLAACQADTGEIYLFHRYVDSGVGTGEGVVLWGASSNKPGEYEYLGSSSWSSDGGTWWATNDSGTHPRDFVTTWNQGRVWMAHQCDSSSGSNDDNIFVGYLGGYSTVTLPGTGQTYLSLPDRVGPEVTWLPYEEPDNMTEWSKVGAGTVTLNEDSLSLDGSSALVYFQRTLTAAPDEGVIAWGSTTVSGTGSPMICQLRLGDGVNDYRVVAEFSDGQSRLEDKVTSTTIDTDTTLDPSNGIEFIVVLWTSYTALWVREITAPSEPDREWLQVAETDSLTDRSTVSSATSVSQIRWGIQTTSADTSGDWHYLHHTEGTYSNAEDLADNWTNPDDLMVRSFGSQPTYVDQGLYITAKDGPAFPGDEQHISPRYAYGVNNSFPRTSASPRKPWWYASGDKLAVQLNSETSSAPPWLSEVLGFALVNAPGTEIDIDAYNGTAWVNYGTLSTVETLGSTTRTGDTFEASAGSAITFDSNELLGAWFYLESGANWILGPIIANSEGDWANGTDLRARVVIDLSRATDSGAPPTSGTGYLFHPSATFITHHNGVNYSAFRFTPTHRCLGTPPDDIAKIGTLFLGPVMVFGQEYSWGRVIETEANVELSEGGDWTRWTRSRSAPRRIVDFAWQDGVDTSNEDFIKGTTDVASLGVASMGGTPGAREGLLRLANGPETPVVYLPSIEVESTRAGTSTVLRRDGMVYGRLLGTVRKESVQGEEGTDEVFRISSISISEEVA